MNRRAQFAHHLKHKVGEYHFRLSEVLAICEQSLSRFKDQLPQDELDGKLLTYSFSALASQVQTIKDIVPVLLDKKVSWSEYKDVRHMNFMVGARNAITHDGNPIINLWVDGRYYIASAFVRIDSKGKTIEVMPPTDDIVKISIEFTHDFVMKLIKQVESVANDPKIFQPIYGREFFEAGMRHPAIPEFAKGQYAIADKSNHDRDDPSRLEDLLSDLNRLLSYKAVNHNEFVGINKSGCFSRCVTPYGI